MSGKKNNGANNGANSNGGDSSAFGGMIQNERREELTARYMKAEQGQMYLFVPTGFSTITMNEGTDQEKSFEVVKGLCSENGKDDFSAMWGETIVVNEVRKGIEAHKIVLGETVLDITFIGMQGKKPNEYKNFKVGNYGKLPNPIPISAE